MAELELDSVKKLMEISAIKNATESVTKFYFDAKTGNKFIGFWCVSVEKTFVFVSNGSYPFLRIFSTPIKMADSCACAILNSAQDNLPGVLNVPANILSATCERISHSYLGQFALSSADTVLLIAEKTVCLVPGISPRISESTGNDNDSDDTTNSFDPIRAIYNIATFPLEITGKIIRGSRSAIQRFQDKPAVEINVIPPEEDKKKHFGVIERIFHLPLRGLHFIGMLAEKRSILRRQISCETTGASREKCQKQMESVDRQWKVLDNLDADYKKEEIEPAESEEHAEDYFTKPSPVQNSPSTISPGTATNQVKKSTTLTKQKPNPTIVKPIKPLDKNKSKPNALVPSSSIKTQRKVGQTAPLEKKRIVRTSLTNESSRKKTETTSKSSRTTQTKSRNEDRVMQ